MKQQLKEINNEGGSGEVSYGGNPKLLFERESDIMMQNMEAPRCSDPPNCSRLSSNAFGEDNVNFEKSKKKKKQKRCYNCGNSGHEGKRCKEVTKCFICSKKGHLVMDCPLKNVEVDSATRLCLKCGSTGHDMFSCSNDYNPEDLKNIECYVCKEFGHLCCVQNTTTGPREASRYNCGKSGHLGSECIKLKEVASDLQLCSKCGQKGHFPQPCIEQGMKSTSTEISMEKDAEPSKSTTRKKPRKSRAKKREKPLQASISSQHNMANPSRSNICSTNAVAAARGIVNHQNRGLPSQQSSYNKVETPLPQHFSHPITQHPHPILRTQTPHHPLNHQTGILISQTVTQRVPQSSFFPIIQLPHPVYRNYC